MENKKVIRQEIFNELAKTDLPISNYLSAGRCAYSASTRSIRTYAGETTRKYTVSERYESPLHERSTASINFRMTDAAPSNSPEEREVSVCLSFELADDNRVLCYMLLPTKKDDCSTEDYLALVEDELSTVLAAQYVVDCMASEKCDGHNDIEAYLNDF